jgi:hypothetical protein
MIQFPMKGMAPVESIKLLGKLEEQVENHLQQAISRLQNLTPAILLKAPSGGGWSIAQCLDHLNGYGDHYLPAIGHGLDNSKMPFNPTFKGTWLGNYFTKMMDPNTGKRKFKTFKNHLPKQDLNPNEVVAEFIRQQELLMHYLRMSHSKDLNQIRIPISISTWIRLKLGDVFQFLIAHNERHLRQAFLNLATQGN